MRVINIEWKALKSGRLVRVIKANKRIIKEQSVRRMLTSPQIERVNIINLLKKRRIEKAKEKKRLMLLEQQKIKSGMVTSKSKIKILCTHCNRIRRLKDVVYDVAPVTGMLYVKGTCTWCNSSNLSRMLRKATKEELNAIGANQHNEEDIGS